MNLDTDTAVVTPTRKRTEQLPRGIRRRGRSLYAYLTVDGHAELRCVGNVTPKFAETQRTIWQREIVEGKYVKPIPRTEQILFRTIADAAIEHAKRYKRCWGTDEQRIKVFKDWWGELPTSAITKEEIYAKLSENLAPKGSWTKTTFNEYRNVLSHVFTLAIEAEEDRPQPAITKNPATKVKL